MKKMLLYFCYLNRFIYSYSICLSSLYQKTESIYAKSFFLLYHSLVFDKNCLNYARNDDFVLPFREKVVPLQTKIQEILFYYCNRHYK